MVMFERERWQAPQSIHRESRGYALLFFYLAMFQIVGMKMGKKENWWETYATIQNGKNLSLVL